MTLQANNLKCVREDRALFEGVSFLLQDKQLLRVEGKNGSGKTTLLRTICGLFQPDEGEVLWNGVAIKEQDENYRKDLLYLGHSNAIKADLSALENIRISTSLAGEKYSEDSLLNALDEIGLFGAEYRPTQQLSQGQKRRVALASLLLSKAKLWVLDEPFVALDGFAVKHLQSLIAKHIEKGGMVVLTTHQEVALTSGDTLNLNLDKQQNELLSGSRDDLSNDDELTRVK